ncbi:MAG: asparagine synthase (glutamine-hydrolyzing) [Anaerolineae bacterium]|nr:asparagine synthase (glutamine-hydrolyzing) [Anaerolineae bacterium]
MCGITGYLDVTQQTSREDLEAIAVRMSDTIVHRGPDDSGVWVDPQVGVALSFRRLAIIDLSPAGHQPMVSADGRYVIVFNGEVYNFESLRRELEGLGHRFRGRSDTEVMLASFAQWGIEEATRRFIGMFAFALWDCEARRLCLVCDRLGIKPLYYGWAGQTFLFGSELKALQAHPAFRNDINRGALTLFLRHNYIPAPYSIYQGIGKLPQGSILSIGPDGAAPSITSYWSAHDIAARGVVDPFTGPVDEAVEQLDVLLRDAINLRMIADVPLGAFLSGGIDSSTVVALMQAQSARPVKTFSIGFHEEIYNEAPFAKTIARHLGTEHTELYVTPEEAMAVIPRLPALYDEPFADSSQIPTFLVSELARRHVTVSLSGDGGDELFTGYDRYAIGRDIWGKIGWLPGAGRGLLAKGMTALSPSAWDALLKPILPLLPYGARLRAGERLHRLAEILRVGNPQAMYLGLLSHFLEPASMVVGGFEPDTIAGDYTRWGHLPDFTQQMMYLDLVTYLPDDILTKVDRASMGVSLEARVPLIDHRVVEFAWRLPLSMKVRGNCSKWLLRQVLYRYVPQKMIERPKMGFGVPIGVWMRGPLRDWVESLLDERRLREEGYFEPDPVRKLWHDHLAGTHDEKYRLWDFLMFQSWLEAQRVASIVQ